MKKIFLFILSLAVPFIVMAAPASGTGLRISLLTCSPGDDAASVYGHSAVRVSDPQNHTDYVFNYGSYDFDEPHFLLKFLKGHLDYFLSVGYYDGFVRAYQGDGRGITEQELDLTEEQKKKLYVFLIENYRPENRYYRYDFLQDNCATRIRDLFETEDIVMPETMTDLTYRDELKRCVGTHRWMMFGIDLILGAKTDRKITTREQMFLPDRLSDNLPSCRNLQKGEASLLMAPVVILQPLQEENHFPDILGSVFRPVTVFLLLFFFFVVFFLRTGQKERFVKIFRAVFYSLLGTGGTIIALMWFCTDHVWTVQNWNLLWMNPLFFLPLLIRSRRVSMYAGNVLTAVSVLMLILSFLVPQTFNPAVSVLILTELAVGLSYTLLSVNKKN